MNTDFNCNSPQFAALRGEKLLSAGQKPQLMPWMPKGWLQKQQPKTSHLSYSWPLSAGLVNTARGLSASREGQARHPPVTLRWSSSHVGHRKADGPRGLGAGVTASQFPLWGLEFSYLRIKLLGKVRKLRSWVRYAVAVRGKTLFSPEIEHLAWDPELEVTAWVRRAIQGRKEEQPLSLTVMCLPGTVTPETCHGKI